MTITIISLIVQCLSIPIQIGCGLYQLHSYYRNDAKYNLSGDRDYLRLRRFNLGLVIWSTFWLAWAVLWILIDLQKMGVLA